VQEIDRVRVLLAVDRHQHVGAGDFLLPRGLDVQDGALDDALEPSVGCVSTSPVPATVGVCCITKSASAFLSSSILAAQAFRTSDADGCRTGRGADAPR